MKLASPKSAVDERTSTTPLADDALSRAVFKLLERLDYRRADSDEIREAIFRLRYQAYMRDHTISANASGTHTDPYDFAKNVYLFGVYVDGELASSIRIHVASREYPDFPTLEVFPEYLQPEIDAGKVIVDSTSFVTHERFSRLYRALPYATLRLCAMCAEYFRADELIAAVQANHQAFYRRMFQYRMAAAPRPYPRLAKQFGLMTVDYSSVAEQMHRRYPFFRSTFRERRMQFEPGRVHGSRISESPIHANQQGRKHEILPSEEEKRHFNAWIEDGEPPLEEGRTYRVGLNVGRLREKTIAGAELRNIDWGGKESLKLLVVLSGYGFSVDRHQQNLSVPRYGDSEDVFFAVVPRRGRSLLLRISIYLERELTLLEEFEIHISLRTFAKVA